MTEQLKSVPLVVTTKHRGVFFGFGIPSSTEEIKLENAQMCISWSSDVRGVLGLAATGPSKNCRVGLPVPAIHLRDVTAVIEASEEAVKAWESKPWS